MTHILEMIDRTFMKVTSQLHTFHNNEFIEKTKNGTTKHKG